MANYTHENALQINDTDWHLIVASEGSDNIDTSQSNLNFEIKANAGDDQITLGNGNNKVYGGNGQDVIYNVQIGDIIFGNSAGSSTGNNQASFSFDQNEILSVTKHVYTPPLYFCPLSNNSSTSHYDELYSEGSGTFYSFKTDEDITYLKAISEVRFSNQFNYVAIDNLVAETVNESAPSNCTNPDPGFPEPKLGSDDTDVFIGDDSYEFFNLLGGNDAVDAGGGDDILDGGLGSNFLTGGDGNDTFFLGGRGEGSVTWSTITDFTSGDFVNIWGWGEGVSQLLLTEASAGAEGFIGVTNHYDLNNDGVIDTSITFSGRAEVPANSPQSVAGNEYLSFI